MDIAELRRIYDEDQRINLQEEGSRREAFPHLVRYVDEHTNNSYVLYSSLSMENVDTVIREQIDYFDNMGHNFEWKYFDYDSPRNLKQRLIAHGFFIEEAEAVLILDLEERDDLLSHQVPSEIRRVTEVKDIGLLMKVLEVVWGSSRAELGEMLQHELTNTPDQLSIYAAYVDDKPVSVAWARFPKDSRFTSLFGGSTLPVHRGHGFYKGLVAARAQEAHSRGRRFLTVDASPMSHPILDRLGFRFLGTSYPCIWRYKPSPDKFTT